MQRLPGLATAAAELIDHQQLALRVHIDPEGDATERCVQQHADGRVVQVRADRAADDRAAGRSQHQRTDPELRLRPDRGASASDLAVPLRADHALVARANVADVAPSNWQDDLEWLAGGRPAAVGARQQALATDATRADEHLRAKHRVAGECRLQPLVGQRQRFGGGEPVDRIAACEEGGPVRAVVAGRRRLLVCTRRHQR